MALTRLDRRYLATALQLATRAIRPSPNPKVGALVVKNHVMVGRGWHEQAGLPHAEPIALARADAQARDATLYVTLEPCRHTGRTPPCTMAILRAGITRVVVGMRDPTSHGGGVELLRRHGVSVDIDPKPMPYRILNQIWLKSIATKLPYLTLKLAFDASGSTIPPAGKKWITGVTARRQVHHLRAAHDAILVGVNTIVADNPRLTVRDIRHREQPTRIVLDPHGRVPHDAHIFREVGMTIVVTRAATKLPRSAENLVVPRFTLPDILRKLYARGVTSIFVEGGATTAKAFIDAGLIDAVAFFHATKPRRACPHFLDRRWSLAHAAMNATGRDTLYTGLLHVY